MPSLADQMPEIDAEIFDAIGDEATIRGQTVPGIFSSRPHEPQLPGGAFEVYERTFDTQVSEVVLAVEENELVTIKGVEYPLIRRLPERGDESGRVTLILGKPK